MYVRACQLALPWEVRSLFRARALPETRARMPGRLLRARAFECVSMVLSDVAFILQPVCNNVTDVVVTAHASCLYFFQLGILRVFFHSYPDLVLIVCQLPLYFPRS